MKHIKQNEWSRDLISDDWDPMFFGNVKDFSEMRIVENGSTRIGRIVDDNGTRPLVNQGFQMWQIDLEKNYGPHMNQTQICGT
jgi:hypothetical protein